MLVLIGGNMHEFDPHGLILQCRRRQQRRDTILSAAYGGLFLAALAGAVSILNLITQ